jgi:hypothetical protein
MIAHNHRVGGAVTHPGSHRTQRADFPHCARRKLVCSTARWTRCSVRNFNAVVRIVTAKHLVEVLNLLRDRLVPHPPHLVLQIQSDPLPKGEADALQRSAVERGVQGADGDQQALGLVFCAAEPLLQVVQEVSTIAHGI